MFGVQGLGRLTITSTAAAATKTQGLRPEGGFGYLV